MNTLGTAVVWGILQVTLFSLVGAVVYALARRRGPAAGALAATASLAMAVVVSVLAFSPWPRWLTMAPQAGEQLANNATEATAPPEAAADALSESPGKTAGSTPKTTRPTAGADLAREAWSTFWQELSQTPATTAPAAWRWPAIVGAIIGAGALAAVLRMLMGIVAVRRYRAATQPINEPNLEQLASQLARQMGCRQAIELRESRVVTTPATVGWRRPLVVLPDGWRGWTETERRVVLAHEIAHVGRGDYAAWLLAQLSLALHFYHPLVHWLARRLRLEQELAADAWGAEASGGRETYLMTLAQMALRQDDRAIAWAARPFLPNRGTFLRRIEMLRDPKQLRYVPSSWRRQTGLVTAVALAGLLIAGLRGPAGDTLAVSQAAQPKTKAQSAATSELRYVPADAVGVLSIRPSTFFEQSEMKPLLEMFNQQIGLQEQLGAPLDQIDEIQVVAARFPSPSDNGPSPMFPAELIVWRSHGPHDWSSLMNRMVPDGVDATFGKFQYTKQKESPGTRPAYSGFTPDDHTLVLAAEPLLRRVMLAAGKPDAGKPEWAAAWQEMSKGHATLMVDTVAFNGAVAAELKRAPGPQGAMIATFAPLWEQSKRLFVGLEVGNGVKIQSMVDCPTPDAAERVRATAEAALTLARNMLDKLGDQIASAPGDQAGPVLVVADLAATLLKQAKLTADGNIARLQADAQIDAADTGIAALAPAIMAAREAAKRTQSMNNLKQIGLAFHNYHDVNGHFPTAAVIGPNGKTPHSWRVAILPFIEGTAIYNQYKFDEPWDSENNKKLISQIPIVFRDPGAEPADHSSSYYVLTGETTIFGPKDGAKIATITDGTSNTILAVEAKR